MRTTRSHIFKIVLLQFLVLGNWVLLVSGCTQVEEPVADYVVTLMPLKMILDPLVEGRKTVACLLPPGTSPHTYALRPSAAQLLSHADAVFYVDDSLDGWLAQMAQGTICSVFDLVPVTQRLRYTTSHAHGNGPPDVDHPLDDLNPHFWGDPQVVAAVVPSLVNVLVKLDPEGKSHYEKKAKAFLQELEALDRDLAESMKRVSSVGLIAFHPSWAYFFKRYGFEVLDYVEPIPGKELTLRMIQRLRTEYGDRDRIAVLSEVQLSRKSADALAEALSAPVIVIDPLGGSGTLESYSALLKYNATCLQEGVL